AKSSKVARRRLADGFTESSQDGARTIGSDGTLTGADHTGEGRQAIGGLAARRETRRTRACVAHEISRTSGGRGLPIARGIAGPGGERRAGAARSAGRRSPRIYAASHRVATGCSACLVRRRAGRGATESAQASVGWAVGIRRAGYARTP